MITGKMLLFTLLSFFMFQSPLSASELESENVDPLANFTVSKDEISKSLDSLKSSGKISDADYQKAKKELGGMSDSQISAIKETAIGMVRNDPDKAVELVNAKKIDTSAVQKQINDLSKPVE